MSCDMGFFALLVVKVCVNGAKSDLKSPKQSKSQVIEDFFVFHFSYYTILNKNVLALVLALILTLSSPLKQLLILSQYQNYS